MKLEISFGSYRATSNLQKSPIRGRGQSRWVYDCGAGEARLNDARIWLSLDTCDRKREPRSAWWAFAV